LANINTSGFKRDSVVIGDFERLYQDKRDELSLQNHTKKAAKFFNRTLNRVPHIVENSIDFSQGAVKRSGNKLDIALTSEDTFFAVLTPSGVRLTQQSSFVLNQDGEITTKEGYKLLPREFLRTTKESISLNGIEDIKIDNSGNIYDKNEKIESLAIVRVKSLKSLQKEGDKLYKADNLEDGLTELNSGNLVKQGFVVMSNVNAVKEMTSLIETNRLVEIYQKVMTTHMDELNRDSINKLATTKA
jgi:flagellar basal-body rod protein FlgG